MLLAGVVGLLNQTFQEKTIDPVLLPRGEHTGRLEGNREVESVVIL
jgi:hypothetical protein